MATRNHDHELLRYRRNQRIIHALLASSFLILLLSGLVLLWDPLSVFASGGTSRLLHRIAAVGFMAVPIAYLIADREGAKELLVDSFKYDRDDIEWIKHMYRYAMGHATEMPPQGRLNAGQKLHHAAVVIVSAAIVVTGLAMWFFKSGLGASGLAWAAIIHDFAMLALTLLLVGHLYFTFVYKALSGMTTGYVPELEAKIEHSKWVEELEAAEHEAAAAKEVPSA
ncbi:MAG: cytochrome b/b6 domain-containing protein [Acidimicrobiia bacterium]|nr:cytochrome b/b6 domain-containing protein [Acidimicrobiia bacterium]